MSILGNAKDAWFVVRRGDTNFSCQGKDLFDKVKDGDEFVVQRGSTAFKIIADWAEFPWEEKFGWYHIKNVTGGELKLSSPSGASTEMWDQNENPVTKIEPIAGVEYYVNIINTNRELNKFTDNPGVNWDFGDNSDVHLLRDGEAMFKGCTHFNGNVDCFRDIPWQTMEEMFMDCTQFNQDISEWYGCGRVINPWEQDRMFFNAAAFVQNLSQWCGVTVNGVGPVDAMTGSGIAGDPSQWPDFTCRTRSNVRSGDPGQDLDGGYDQ